MTLASREWTDCSIILRLVANLDVPGGIRCDSCPSSPKLALLLAPGSVSVLDGRLGALARSDSCSQAGPARWLRRLTCAEFVWDGLGSQAGLIRRLPL